MCIAIFKREDSKLFKSTLENCFRYHPDGAGFVAHDAQKNKLILHKGFFSFDAFWKEYKIHAAKRMLIHFRWLTHGEKNEKNCHPFMVNDNLAFVHNGVIREVREWDKDMSDTWHFGESILKPLVRDYPDIIGNESINILLEDYIGKNSKLIFMDNMGKVTIINEASGEWNKEIGCWFSNDTYKKVIAKNRERGAGGTSTITYPQYSGYHSSGSGINEFYETKGRSEQEILLEKLFEECEREEMESAKGENEKEKADISLTTV